MILRKQQDYRYLVLAATKLSGLLEFAQEIQESNEIQRVELDSVINVSGVDAWVRTRSTESIQVHHWIDSLGERPQQEGLECPLQVKELLREIPSAQIRAYPQVLVHRALVRLADTLIEVTPQIHVRREQIVLSVEKGLTQERLEFYLKPLLKGRTGLYGVLSQNQNRALALNRYRLTHVAIERDQNQSQDFELQLYHDEAEHSLKILPLSMTELESHRVRLLNEFGFHTLADIQSEWSSLQSRLSKQESHQLRQLIEDEYACPIALRRDPSRIEQSFEFEIPIEKTSTLRFILARACERLLEQSHARNRQVQSVGIECRIVRVEYDLNAIHHEEGVFWETLRVDSVHGFHEAKALSKLIMRKLEATIRSGPLEGIRLWVESSHRRNYKSVTLGKSCERSAHHGLMRWLDEIKNALKETNVGRVCLLNQVEPEKASALKNYSRDSKLEIIPDEEGVFHQEWAWPIVWLRERVFLCYHYQLSTLGIQTRFFASLTIGQHLNEPGIELRTFHQTIMSDGRMALCELFTSDQSLYVLAWYS